MLVSPDKRMIDHARKLSTQAREPAPHYQHAEIGYNYRLSNVLAAIGRGQLRVLTERVAARRRNFEAYRQRAWAICQGSSSCPRRRGACATRWLTCITVDPARFGADREALRLALEGENIEARPVWKPMHLQPVFAACERIGGEVAQDLFERGPVSAIRARALPEERSDARRRRYTSRRSAGAAMSRPEIRRSLLLRVRNRHLLARRCAAAAPGRGAGLCAAAGQRPTPAVRADHARLRPRRADHQAADLRRPGPLRPLLAVCRARTR